MDRVGPLALVRQQHKMTEAQERLTEVTAVDKMIQCRYFAVNDPQHALCIMLISIITQPRIGK